LTARAFTVPTEAPEADGTYGWDADYFERMLRAGAVDVLQAMPRVVAASAIPNLRHLEYFADHVRVEGLLFDGVVTPSAGRLVPPAGGIGNGLQLGDGAERYLVRKMP
jgi:hypothetical protein